jgi:hypothetical protein
MKIQDLSAGQFRRAATIKEQIERLSKELSIIFGLSGNSPAAPRTKRSMSASARKKIAAAQRARWENLRRAKPATRSVKPAAKAKKKTMSAAAKRKLSAKLKAYWAQKKARQK